jgi:hypothetical protein
MARAFNQSGDQVMAGAAVGGGAAGPRDFSHRGGAGCDRRLDMVFGNSEAEADDHERLTLARPTVTGARRAKRRRPTTTT